MKVIIKPEELKKLIAENKEVDETVLDYICTIVSEGVIEDILGIGLSMMKIFTIVFRRSTTFAH